MQFFNKTVSVMRLATVSGNRKSLQTVQSADCEIQNVDSIQGRSLEGVASKTYMAWFDPQEDIREGDVLRDQNSGKRFKVIGVERQGQGLGLEGEHLEVTMTRFSM